MKSGGPIFEDGTGWRWKRGMGVRCQSHYDDLWSSLFFKYAAGCMFIPNGMAFVTSIYPKQVSSNASLGSFFLLFWCLELK